MSVFISMLSLYFLMEMAPEGKFLGRPIRFWLTSAYFILSVFLWSSLGSREGFILFSFVVIFYLLVNPKNLSFRNQYLLIVAVSTFLLISKTYLYLLLVICLLTSALILRIFKQDLKEVNLKLFLAFLVPLCLFPTITTNVAEW